MVGVIGVRRLQNPGWRIGYRLACLGSGEPRLFHRDGDGE